MSILRSFQETVRRICGAPQPPHADYADKTRLKAILGIIAGTPSGDAALQKLKRDKIPVFFSDTLDDYVWGRFEYRTARNEHGFINEKPYIRLHAQGDDLILLASLLHEARHCQQLRENILMVNKRVTPTDFARQLRFAEADAQTYAVVTLVAAYFEATDPQKKIDMAILLNCMTDTDSNGAYAGMFTKAIEIGATYGLDVLRGAAGRRIIFDEWFNGTVGETYDANAIKEWKEWEHRYDTFFKSVCPPRALLTLEDLALFGTLDDDGQNYLTDVKSHPLDGSHYAPKIKMPDAFLKKGDQYDARNGTMRPPRSAP